jgi:hypothetical protein
LKELARFDASLDDDLDCQQYVRSALKLAIATDYRGRRWTYGDRCWEASLVPSQEYFACAESDMSDTTSFLTVTGGKVVDLNDRFAQFITPILLCDVGLVADAPLWRLRRVSNRRKQQQKDAGASVLIC